MHAMQVDIGSAELVLRNVAMGDSLTIAEIRGSADAVVLQSGQPGRLIAPNSRITMTMTEVALNRIIAGLPIEKVSDLEIATLSGFLRITGRIQMALGIRLPFELDGGLETPGGNRVLLQLRSARVIGAGAPTFLMPTIQDKVNQSLGAATDASLAPFPLRYEKVTVEPGRVVIYGIGSLNQAVRFTPPKSPAEAAITGPKEQPCATP